MILHPTSQKVVVVDPGEADPVLTALSTHSAKLDGILLTHHHWDHTGGVKDLVKTFDVPVYGPESITDVTHPVKEGDSVLLKSIDCQFKVIEIPGHTLDHIAYVGEGAVFCGDTLFMAGCGRVFEGTFPQMYHSLQKLAALPAETWVYCAHEYTAANLRFAQTVDPINAAITQRIKEVSKLRENNKPTVPAQLSVELNTNPFLRCEQKDLQAAASTHANKTIDNAIDTFTVIRTWKDGL